MEPLPVIELDGNEYAIIVLLQLLVQPSPFVTVTVNVPAVDVVMHCVVAPVFQR